MNPQMAKAAKASANAAIIPPFSAVNKVSGSDVGGSDIGDGDGDGDGGGDGGGAFAGASAAAP